MLVVLDACAMLALLNNEQGGDVVLKYLNDPNIQCLAHAVNLCEVFYHFVREDGEPAALAAIATLDGLGVVERNDFDRPFWQEVGRLKGQHRASLADFCAIALTNLERAELLTSDHHEMDAIKDAGICRIIFIR